jgi:hypothetical protein
MFSCARVCDPQLPTMSSVSLTSERFQCRRISLPRKKPQGERSYSYTGEATCPCWRMAVGEWLLENGSQVPWQACSLARP